jgi:leucyl aminopeptidase
MARLPAIAFAKPELPSKGTVAFLVEKDGGLPKPARPLDRSGQLTRAIAVSEFKGKLAASIEVISPTEGLDRIVLIGCGTAKENGEAEWMKIGGAFRAAAAKSAVSTLFAEAGDPATDARAIAAIAAGAKLRAYAFDA